VDKSDNITVYWYIIFKGSTLKHWLFKYLQPGFKHCYAVRESPGGQFWIIMNNKSCYTDVTMVSKLDYPHIRTLEPNSVILSIRAIINPENYRHTFCVFNCVEVCKSVLGIKSFWCWTPYQLYKELTHG